jgi:hypothetical protein
MAGFLIAGVACLLPFLLGTFGLGRTRVVIGIGGVVAVAWIVSLTARPPEEKNVVPLWFVAGLVVLLYALWCGGFWLGRRVRRIRGATPG